MSCYGIVSIGNGLDADHRVALLRELPKVVSRALSLPYRPIHPNELRLADMSEPEPQKRLVIAPDIDLLFDAVIEADAARRRQRKLMADRLETAIASVAEEIARRQIRLSLLEPAEFNLFQERGFPYHRVVSGLRRPLKPRYRPWCWPVRIKRDRWEDFR